MSMALGAYSAADWADLTTRAVTIEHGEVVPDVRLRLFIAGRELFGRQLVLAQDPADLAELVEEFVIDPRLMQLVDAFSSLRSDEDSGVPGNQGVHPVVHDLEALVRRDVNPELGCEVARAFRAFGLMSRAMDLLTKERFDRVAPFFSKSGSSLAGVAYDFTVPVPVKDAVLASIKPALLFLAFAALQTTKPTPEHWVGQTLVHLLEQYSRTTLQLLLPLVGDQIPDHMGIEPLDLAALFEERQQLLAGIENMVSRARASNEGVFDPFCDGSKLP